jgi:DNA-binding NarL/FixJ family response regulator
MTKRIIHIDDHLLFAQGIKLIFEGHADFKLEHHFANTTDAIRFCSKNIPDLLLMDYYLHEGN